MAKRGVKGVEEMPKISGGGDFLSIEHPISRVPRTLGQRAADGLTKYAGSWTFIISLGIFLFFWMGVNTAWILFGRNWDPYPFILLNFILSTLAAIQAPIILMSQNRESQKDRIRAQYDYAVNKKAEKEIRLIQKELKEIRGMLGRRNR